MTRAQNKAGKGDRIGGGYVGTQKVVLNFKQDAQNNLTKKLLVGLADICKDFKYYSSEMESFWKFEKK